jgi:hypothetical protein
MSTLLELQRSFQRHVVAGDAKIASQVLETERVPVATRLAIYSNAYRLRLIEALGDSYSRLRELVGDEAFDALARRYIELNPSPYRSIRWFGDQMPALLASEYSSQPWLHELARWQWEAALAFDGPNATPVTLDAFASVAPERWPQLTFAFHPTLQRLELATNAVALFKALSAEDLSTPDIPAPQVGEPRAWVIWRKKLATNFRSLEPAEAAALDSVIAGNTFQEMCERLCEHLDADAVPGAAASYLKGWASDEMITSLSVRDD